MLDPIRKAPREKFIYSLRLTIQPGHHEESSLADLKAFCIDARIDDVMFFINGEELNQGHQTLEEIQPWLDLIARGRDMLQPLGITTSINPWPTLLHGDRGRQLRPSQHFDLMVDPYGRQATAVACPLCPEWRSYLASVYALYASAKPEFVWVEDDFRLHNHAPLQWGGCFCERHMAEYARRAGQALSREDFLAGLLQPGKPHPYRRIWLETSRDTMVENARIIGQAVRAVSPHTRVGLMSSVPSVHAAEGRDWHGILNGLAAGRAPVIRPHLPSYTEVSPQSYALGFAAVSSLTCAVIPPQTEIYPELENFPHSRFAKSKTFTQFQIESALALGAEGITLNLYDMMGNGILPGEGYQTILAANKDYLDAVTRLNLKQAPRAGVKVLVSPKHAWHMHLDGGSGMNRLYPSEVFWAQLLSALGIACTYCLDDQISGQVVALTGQILRALDRTGIESLFQKNTILLDGDAAMTLLDLGLGDLAGIKAAGWRQADEGCLAYEQATAGQRYCNLQGARISAQSNVGDYLQIDYQDAADIESIVYDAYGRETGPGLATFHNRVLVLPYGRFAAQGIHGHLNPVRQEMMQAVIQRLAPAGGRPACVADEPFVQVHDFQTESSRYLMLVNSSHDPVERVRIRLGDPLSGRPGDQTDLTVTEKQDQVRIKRLDHKTCRFLPVVTQQDGAFTVLESSLAALDHAVFSIDCDPS